jgi:hypothetical protein
LLRFVVSLLIAGTVLCSAVQGGVSAGLFPAPSFYVRTTIFIAITTFVIYRRLAVIKAPDEFVQAYLLSISMQLMLLLGFIGVVLYIDTPGAAANAVYFLINCLVFIGLEVTFLFLERRK